MEKAGDNTASSGSLRINVNIPRPTIQYNSSSPTYVDKTFAVKKASNIYLKNVFPGGFNLKNAKGDVVRESSVLDQFSQSSMLLENSFGGSIREMNANSRSTLKPPSVPGLAKIGAQEPVVNDKTFFSWTRGNFHGEGDDNTDANMTDGLLSDDPFGNVAGQYMSSRDRARLRSGSSTLRTIKPHEEEGVEFIGVLTAYEKKLSTPYSKQHLLRTSSLSSRGKSREVVYNPPPSLGALDRPKSSKLGSAVYDNSVYNDWLASSRQAVFDVDSGVGKSAGGRISANRGSPAKGLVQRQSPLQRAPDKAAPAADMGGYQNINDDIVEFFVPSLPSDTIEVEIYQYKHVIQTTKVSKFKVVAKISISADIKLSDFKRILTDVDPQNNFSAVLSFDITAFYFNNYLKAWKELKANLDFDHAILIANELKTPLKVMYTCMKNRDVADAARSQYSQNNSRGTLNSKEGQSRGTSRSVLKTAALLYDDSGLFGDDESSNSAANTMMSQTSVDSKSVYKSKNHNYSPSILLIPPGPQASSPDHTVISKFNDLTIKPNFKKQEQLAKFLQQKLLKTKW